MHDLANITSCIRMPFSGSFKKCHIGFALHKQCLIVYQEYQNIFHLSTGDIPACYSNIARAKTARQSSGLWYTQPNRAVDGNDDSVFCHGSCTVTQLDFEPWLQVDLVKSRSVYYIELTTADELKDGEFLKYKYNYLSIGQSILVF